MPIGAEADVAGGRASRPPPSRARAAAAAKPPSGRRGAASTVRSARGRPAAAAPVARARREPGDRERRRASGAGAAAGRACGAAAGRRPLASISSIGVTSATWLPYSPTPSEIAPAFRSRPSRGRDRRAREAGADAGRVDRGAGGPHQDARAARARPACRSRRGPRRRTARSWCLGSPTARCSACPAPHLDSGMIGSAARAAGASVESQQSRQQGTAKQAAEPSVRIAERRTSALAANMRQHPSRPTTTRRHACRARSASSRRRSPQEPFALQNSKLLKVSLDEVTIQAKLGSMVAYQGEVSFEHAGSGGMGRLIKKAVTGEGAVADEDVRDGRGVPGRPGAGHPPAQARERLDHLQRRATCSPSTPASTGTSSRSRAAAA